MRTPFDRLAKDLFKALLEPACRTVTPEREVSGESQRLDLWCDPDPRRLAGVAHLELLHRMLRDGPCAFEFFHAAPSLDQVLGGLRKVLSLRHRGANALTLWIVAAGRPDRAFYELPSLRPVDDWPCGTYGLDRGLGLRLIVTNELPRTPETLVLRLLGARRTLRDALADLHQLPDDDTLGRTARPMVIELLREAAQKLPSTPEHQEFVMELQEYQELYEKWQRDLLAEGEARGRAEGEARAIVAFLRARRIPVSDEAARRIEATTDPHTLEVWLSRAATVSSVDELFG